MNIEVKKAVKPVDYMDSMKILEKRVEDVFLDKKDELLWILEHDTVYTAGTSSKRGRFIRQKFTNNKNKQRWKTYSPFTGSKSNLFCLKFE